MDDASNPMQALNEHFYYNIKLAKALQQFLPPFGNICLNSLNRYQQTTLLERKMIQLWIDKLVQLNKSLEQMAIRSDYMWFIMLMLQSKNIREPFTRLPPPDILPLKKFVPIQTYEQVLICNEPNMIYRPSKSSILYKKEKSIPSTSCSSLREKEFGF